MNPVVSVIIPCFRVEAFLPDIMIDLREQSFKDFEIILINDGGGDHLLTLMYHFKTDDDRVVIIDQPNGGVSSARNAGLNIAKGEYIVFVDPDDRLKPYYLQSLLAGITSRDADIAVGGFVVNYTMEKRTESTLLNPSFLSSDYNKRAEYLLSMDTICSPLWNKIYRTDFLKKHDVNFNIYMRYSEDELFNLQCLLLTNRLVLLPEIGYLYMCRDSDSVSSKHIKQFKENRELALSYRMEVLRKIGVAEKRITDIWNEGYYLLGYFCLCNLFKKGCPLSFKEKKEYIKKYIWEDKSIKEAFYAHCYKNTNLFTYIYVLCFKFHSVTFAACTFRSLYYLKYNFKRTYINLIPYLKRCKL